MSVRRAFHVDAHKISFLPRMLNQGTGDIRCELLIDIEAHMRKLQADVGVEFALADTVEKLVIKLRALASFLRICDVLAEVIEAYAHAERVCLLRSL